MLTDYNIRLPNQFLDSTNLKALITIFADKVKEGNDILDYLLLNTLDDAAGVWLDEIGNIVGVPRASQQLTDNEIFAYCSFADYPGVSTRGFSEIADPQGGHYLGLDENGYPCAYTGTPLDDTDYRTLIRAKVLSSYSGDSINDQFNWINDVFGVTSYVYTSNPCEVAIELDEYLTFYQRFVLYNYIPLAAGVRVWIAENPPYVPPVILDQLEDEEL